MYRNDYMALVCYFLAVKKNILFIYRSSSLFMQLPQVEGVICQQNIRIYQCRKHQGCNEEDSLFGGFNYDLLCFIFLFLFFFRIKNARIKNASMLSQGMTV